MNWKLTGNGPVYQQIMAVLRGAVLSGEYAPGQRIPSARELAADARVNPNTMQRALWELEREGLLVCHGTLGRVVTESRETLDAIRRDEVEKLAKDCLTRFKALGLSPNEAGGLLRRLGESEEKQP